MDGNCKMVQSTSPTWEILPQGRTRSPDGSVKHCTESGSGLKVSKVLYTRNILGRAPVNLKYSTKFTQEALRITEGHIYTFLPSTVDRHPVRFANMAGYKGKVFYNKSSEAQKQIAQRDHKFPSPGDFQGQTGWGADLLTELWGSQFIVRELD